MTTHQSTITKHHSVLPNLKLGEEVDLVVGLAATALAGDQLIRAADSDKKHHRPNHKVGHLAAAGVSAAVAAGAFNQLYQEHQEHKHHEAEKERLRRVRQASYEFDRDRSRSRQDERRSSSERRGRREESESRAWARSRSRQDHGYDHGGAQPFDDGRAALPVPDGRFHQPEWAARPYASAAPPPRQAEFNPR